MFNYLILCWGGRGGVKVSECLEFVISGLGLGI